MHAPFIVLEGADKVGKTTQCKRLATRLSAHGYDVIETRQPGGTDLGNWIREMVKHQPISIDPLAMMHLYLADKAQHLSDVIEPARRDHKAIVCDRFEHSTLVYQSAGLGARGGRMFYSLSDLVKICRRLRGDTVPDVCVILDPGVPYDDETDAWSSLDPHTVLHAYRTVRGAFELDYPVILLGVGGMGPDQVEEKIWATAVPFLDK